VISLTILTECWTSSVAERPCEGSRGFEPTVPWTGGYRVAARRLMERCRTAIPGFKRRSATQAHLDDANRGLKPTATIMKSLPRLGGRSCNHEMGIRIRATPKVMRRHDIRGRKARDMGRLAGNSPSYGSGFQPSIFRVMPSPMALPWAGMIPGRWP